MSDGSSAAGGEGLAEATRPIQTVRHGYLPNSLTATRNVIDRALPGFAAACEHAHAHEAGSAGSSRPASRP